MDDYSHAVERTPVDFVLFAIGFIGFMTGVAGVIMSSAGWALAGAVLLLLAVWSFAE